MQTLFSPFDLKGLKLSNRIVMAPMTRCRANFDGIPSELNATYYAQRASCGLIITEATNISDSSCSFEKAPGIFTKDQIKGWQLVTNKVHKTKGHIFMQLWHAGRVGSSILLKGKPPLAPSFIDSDLDKLNVYKVDSTGCHVKIEATAPKEMSIKEIKETINH